MNFLYRLTSYLKRYYHTLKYLKLKQIFYRLLRLSGLFSTNLSITSISLSQKHQPWIKSISKKKCMNDDQEFIFLNIKGHVDCKNDWNNREFSKLWLYNLHYFDYINSFEENSFERECNIIKLWISDNPPFCGIGWEPYTTSLRIINWIKWLYENNYSDTDIEHSIFLQSRHLFNNIEYHILGNHVISNAKALIFSGLFFKGSEPKKWLSKGKLILKNELSEQILFDGGHYELSPMYHAIILEDFIDLYNILSCFKENSKNELVDIILKMFNWLNLMMHPDKEISFFNDSVNGIASSIDDIRSYCERLDINLGATDKIIKDKSLNDLKDSGYTSYANEDIFMITDRGNIGPDYLPGHAHADTLSFELSLFKQRFIVNLGTSTYEDSPQRLEQRGTANHSTLLINNKNSSNIWSSFRVAERAKIIRKLNQITNDRIILKGAHNGYTNLDGSPIHEREWHIFDNKIEINDNVIGNGTQNIKLVFPLHPHVKILKINDNIVTCLVNDKEASIIFPDGMGKIKLQECDYHPNFGLSIATIKIVFKVVTDIPVKIKTTISWY